MTNLNFAPPAPMPEFLSDDTTERFTLKWGLWTALKLAATEDVKTVLDLGSGAGEHTRFLRHFGKEVYTNDWKTDSDYPGDILDIDFKGKQFDAVLCSHVMEHQRNVGLFLDKMISLVRDGGVIAMALPGHPQQRFVTGHLTVWSIALASYNLMQAGIDCAEAQCLLDNECTIVVRKKMIDFNEIKEAKWNDVNLMSGQGLSEDTTLPWHDDERYLARYMPHNDARNENVRTSLDKINWDPDFAFPLPQNTKDIAIMTAKSAKPISLQYEMIKARATERKEQI